MNNRLIVILAFLCTIAIGPALRADNIQVFEINPNLPIPPNDMIEIDIDVVPDPSCRYIVDIDVGLLIPHTWQGDLRLTLTHTETARSAVLFDRPGSPQGGIFGFSADNYGNPTNGELFFLDDEADELYDSPPFGTVPHPGIANVTGSWLAEESLSIFDGIDATGIWRLRIEDFGGGDIGTLNILSLHIATVVPEPRALFALAVIAVCFAARRIERR